MAVIETRAGSSAPARHRLAATNRAVLAVLHVPVVRRLFESRIGELQYLGRRSGRIVTLPVQYARTDGRLVVLVGHAAAKTWWRNFTMPHPVDVFLRGRWRHASARAVAGGEPGWITARTQYALCFPRIRMSDSDVFVVIALLPEEV